MDSKEFNASKDLNLRIKKLEKQDFSSIIFGFVIYLIFFLLIWNKPFYLLVKIIIEIGLTIVLSPLFYTNGLGRSRLITNTIKRVEWRNDQFFIETFSFRILRLKNIPSKFLTARKNEITTRQVDYKLKDRRNLGDECIEIRYKSEKFFLLMKFFDPEIKNLF